jgi:hypothetical protein
LACKEIIRWECVNTARQSKARDYSSIEQEMNVTATAVYRKQAPCPTEKMFVINAIATTP